MRRSLVFISLFTIISSVFSPVASAASGIGGRPALPRENEPRSQSIFIHTINKGGVADDKVLVQNSSNERQTILLYAVDAIPSNTGAFTCKQRVEPLTDAGGWINLAQNEVTLDAGKETIVDFTINVPETADVGEHNACLTFETKGDEGQVNGNLRIRTRTAVRVALTVPGELRRALEIESYTVTQNNYQQLYDITLKNTGNVSADTKISIKLSTLLGGTVYSNGGEYPVLAGQKLQLSYQNASSPLFGGWYKASASASYDGNATTWGTSRTSQLVNVFANDRIVFLWPRPLGIAILVFVLAALVALTWWFVQRLRLHRSSRTSWSKYTVKQGDTVQTLAEIAGIKWRHIVRVNHIKAPYTLEPGSTISLPAKKAPESSHKTKKVK